MCWKRAAADSIPRSIHQHAIIVMSRAAKRSLNQWPVRVMSSRRWSGTWKSSSSKASLNGVGPWPRLILRRIFCIKRCALWQRQSPFSKNPYRGVPVLGSTGIKGVLSTGVSLPVARSSSEMSVGSQSCLVNVAASTSRRAFWSNIFSLATLGARCIKFLDCKNSRTSLNGMALVKG